MSRWEVSGQSKSRRAGTSAKCRVSAPVRASRRSQNARRGWRFAVVPPVRAGRREPDQHHPPAAVLNCPHPRLHRGNLALPGAAVLAGRRAVRRQPGDAAVADPLQPAAVVEIFIIRRAGPVRPHADVIRRGDPVVEIKLQHPAPPGAGVGEGEPAGQGGVQPGGGLRPRPAPPRRGDPRAGGVQHRRSHMMAGEIEQQRAGERFVLGEGLQQPGPRRPVLRQHRQRAGGVSRAERRRVEPELHPRPPRRHDDVVGPGEVPPDRRVQEPPPQRRRIGDGRPEPGPPQVRLVPAENPRRQHGRDRHGPRRRPGGPVGGGAGRSHGRDKLRNRGEPRRQDRAAGTGGGNGGKDFGSELEAQNWKLRTGSSELEAQNWK